LIPKHREVLNISLDPPRNETDITQNKKIRQCVFVKLSGKDLQRVARRSFVNKKELMQEPACAQKNL